ncbi:MAG: hypothetical protein ACUVR0_03930, partial [Candidatus Aminicenantales bacterium]
SPFPIPVADLCFPFIEGEGNCPFFNYRIIDSPQDGTSLCHEENVEILIDFGQDLQPPDL